MERWWRWLWTWMHKQVGGTRWVELPPPSCWDGSLPETGAAVREWNDTED